MGVIRKKLKYTWSKAKNPQIGLNVFFLKPSSFDRIKKRLVKEKPSSVVLPFTEVNIVHWDH